MADAKHKAGSSPPPKFKANKAVDHEKGHGGANTTPHPAAEHRSSRLLRWACCGLAAAGALFAVVMLALSLTVLKVRDPTLSMESVEVTRFNVRLGARPLQINVTLLGSIVIRNPNYESMRFGASDTEILIVDSGVPDYVVGVGRAPPGVVPARGATRVAADIDVLVDRVGPDVVGDVLFGGGEVQLASHTALDGRISVLGGLYGRRTVRVAMRCRVALRVSAATVLVAGSPSCVVDFARMT